MIELATRSGLTLPRMRLLAASFAALSSFGMLLGYPPAMLLGVAIAGAGLCLLLGVLGKGRVPVRVDAQGITMRGALVMPRANIEDARFFAVDDKGPYVLVRGKGDRSVVIDVATREQATEVTRELGVDVGALADEFSVVAPAPIAASAMIARVVLGLALAMVGLFTKATPLVVLGPLIAIFASSVVMPATLRVRAEGLRYALPWKERFFPLERIAWVAPTNNGIQVTMIDGATAKLPIASSSLGRRGKVTQKAILQSIHAARARRAVASSEAVAVGSRIGRGDRTIAAWLASLVGEEESFRAADLRLEDLVDVLNVHAASPSDQRLAAAVLLAKRGGDEARARIRVAADAPIAPKLRIALDAIADGKDAAALEEAIRAAEEEASAQEGRG